MYTKFFLCRVIWNTNLPPWKDVKKKKNNTNFLCGLEVGDANGQSVIWLHVSWPTESLCTPVFGQFLFQGEDSRHSVAFQTLAGNVRVAKKKEKKPHQKKKKLAGSVMANMAAPTRNTFMCMYTHTHANVRETVTPFTLTLPRLPLDGYVLYVLRQTAILMACHKLTNQLRMIRYLEPLK